MNNNIKKQNWQLENRVYQGKVRQILPLKSQFKLVLNDGKVLVASRVIIATNYGNPQLPEWVYKIKSLYPTETLCPSIKINLPTISSLQNERILIIGGGLTSGHLAIGAIKRGAKVVLMARREFQEKLFDADAGWLGPKYLKGFNAEPDWYKRWEMIQQARNGGSLTPKMMTKLRQLAHEGKIELWENCQIKEARWQDEQWQVICNTGIKDKCDRIWLATGTKFNVAEHPLLSDILAADPIEIVAGLPVLDQYLRLGKREFFLMGSLAALQVGPVARNISGGRKASELIVAGLTKYRKI